VDGSLRAAGSAGSCLDAWQCGTDHTHPGLVDVFPCHPNGTSECGYKNQQWEAGCSFLVAEFELPEECD
jgi:hypothetical protein